MKLPVWDEDELFFECGKYFLYNFLGYLFGHICQDLSIIFRYFGGQGVPQGLLGESYLNLHLLEYSFLVFRQQ